MANVTYGELKERLDNINLSKQKLLGQIEAVNNQLKKRRMTLTELGLVSEDEARKKIATEEKRLAMCMQKLDELLDKMEK